MSEDAAVGDARVLDSLKRLTLELRETRERLQAAADERREPIAIVGMSCRFPDAATPNEFWKNLCAGRGSVRDLTEDDLRRAGTDLSLRAHPHYVARGVVLGEVLDVAVAHAHGALERLVELRAREPQRDEPVAQLAHRVDAEGNRLLDARRHVDAHPPVRAGGAG